MKLVWARLAIEDRRTIFDYIEADSPNAAIEIDERIFQAAERLLDFPESGRLGRVEGTRELVISGTPFIAPYKISGDRVRILRIIHGARLWPDILSDSE